MKCKKTVKSDVLPLDDAGQEQQQRTDIQTRNGSRNSLLSEDSKVSITDNNTSQDLVEKRLDSLESLLYKLTENIWPQAEVTKSDRAWARSPARSSVGSLPESKSQRKHAQSPSRCNYAYDTLFQDEDINIISFEHVMIATFRTMQELWDENQNLSGLISHGLFMAEKAAAGVYVADSFTGYDRLVCKKASKKGLEFFGKVSELERN